MGAAAFVSLSCATTNEASWSPAPPTPELRRSLVNGIKAGAGEFIGMYGVQLGMSTSEAEERLGSGWSCRRLGSRSTFFQCSHDGDFAPTSVGLQVEKEQIVAISLHWPSGETLASVCSEYQAAIRELITNFGNPTSQDTSLCEQQRDEPAYVGSCAKWELGSSALEILAKPLLENLNQVGMGLGIGPAETSTCRPEDG